MADKIVEFLRKLRQARIDRGFSQNQLAKELGISQQYLGKIELGERIMSDQTVIKRWSTILGMQPEEFQEAIVTQRRAKSAKDIGEVTYRLGARPKELAYRNAVTTLKQLSRFDREDLRNEAGIRKIIKAFKDVLPEDKVPEWNKTLHLIEQQDSLIRLIAGETNAKAFFVVLDLAITFLYLMKSTGRSVTDLRQAFEITAGSAKLHYRLKAELESALIAEMQKQK